jgi:hypothetical protein
VQSARKHLKINLKVLLVMVVYLFFHIANAFFGPRRIHEAGKHHVMLLKQDALILVHLQKTAKTTFSENRLSFARLIQNASKLFILLLFFAASVPVICYLFPPITGVSSDPPYLRFCVIRI